MTMQFKSSASMVGNSLERYPQMLADNPALRVIAADLSKKLRDALEASAPDCDPVALPCTAQCSAECLKKASSLGDGSESIELEGGKYKVVFYPDGRFVARRYGEEWRDLSGDKMVYLMFAEILRLRETGRAA